VNSVTAGGFAASFLIPVGNTAALLDYVEETFNMIALAIM
jgi:hypothetical protein